MLIGFLCADSRHVAFAGAYAVPFWAEGEYCKYLYHCHLYSSDIPGRGYGRETGAEQEIFVGAFDGEPVFCRIGGRFPCRKQERVRRQWDVRRDGELNKGQMNGKNEKSSFPMGKTMLYYNQFMNIRRFSDEAHKDFEYEGL